MRKLPFKRVGAYMAAVVLIATICKYAAYAAVVSYKGIFDLDDDDLDPRAIADHVQYVTGGLGLIGAFVLLAIQG